MNKLGSQNILSNGWLSTNLFQEPTLKQLQQQSDQLAKLQQLGEEQKKQLEAKLQQLSQLLKLGSCTLEQKF